MFNLLSGKTTANEEMLLEDQRTEQDPFDMTGINIVICSNGVTY